MSEISDPLYVEVVPKVVPLGCVDLQMQQECQEEVEKTDEQEFEGVVSAVITYLDEEALG